MQATTASSRRNFKIAMAAAIRMRCRRRLRRHHQTKRMTSVKSHVKRLRVEMKEISAEQRRIRKGQRQVREKFQSIGLKCEQLRKETMLITQQSANTQIKLTLMFQILKARENHEFDKAAIFTHALRKLMDRENQQRKL